MTSSIYELARSAIVGFPPDPNKKPSPGGVLEAFRRISDAVDAGLSNGGLVYDTKANMDADLAHDANASAWVIADSTVANNGIYRKSGASGSGSWTRVGDLPYSFIKASNAGSGTANAIQATTWIPIPAGDGAAEIVLNITENNTGAATVSFNGGSALTIKTATGADVQADYLVAGAVVSGFVLGSTFRLTSEVGTAAAAAAAQAAADAAAASAASVDYRAVSTADDIAAITPSLTLPAFLVLNQYNDDPAEPIWWLTAATDPGHAMAIQDSAGGWWEYAQARGKGFFNPRHFGPCPNGGDCSVALRKMMDLMLFKGGGVALIPPGRYYVSEELAREFSAGLTNEYAIITQGKYSTQFIFDAASLTGTDQHLVGFRQTSLGVNSRYVQIALEILIDGIIDATAVSCSKPKGGIGPTSTVTLLDNIVRGLANHGNYVKNGYDYSGQFYSFVWRNEFNGDSNTGQPTVPRDDSHPAYQAGTAFNSSETYGGSEIGNAGRYCKVAFENTWDDTWVDEDGNPRPSGEGIERINNRAGEVLIGHRYRRPGPEPSNRWHSNYADARDCGFWLEGTFAAKFADNEVYMYTPNGLPNGSMTMSPVDTNTGVEFYFKGCYDLVISGSKHRGQDFRKAAYVFDAKTTPAGVTTQPHDISIERPSFEGYQAHSMVRAYLGATNIVVEKPRYSGSVAITNNHVGNITKSEIGIVRRDPQMVTLSLSTGLTVPSSSTLTPIPWTESSDPLNAHATGSAEIIVPANMGFRSASVHFQGTYAGTGTTGQRQFDLQKNGAVFQNGLSVSGQASGLFRINQTTKRFPVTGGDILEFLTAQTSGSDQTLTAGQTWATVTFHGEKPEV
jgi:hypothetical protein